MNNQSFYRWTAAVLIFEGVIFFVILAILGIAINWPASLDEPASVNLPLILEQANGVRNGYMLYLIYSVLILPIAVMVAYITANGKRLNVALQISVGFGVASAVLRVLGIIRWLIPMPALATAYTDSATSDSTRESIAIVYDMLNNYAGTVGEVLGVGFFAAFWLATLSLGMWQARTFPRWFAIYGFLT
ncbi:MAG: DUF4386 family protein, partial [Chloroflexota bacterium]